MGAFPGKSTGGAADRTLPFDPGGSDPSGDWLAGLGNGLSPPRRDRGKICSQLFLSHFIWLRVLRAPNLFSFAYRVGGDWRRI